MRVLGIDPGVTGAWAVIETGAGVVSPIVGRSASTQERGSGNNLLIWRVGDLDTTPIKLSKRITHRLDADKLFHLIRELGPLDRIVVERLHASPGVTSGTAFSLGWSGGVLDAVLDLSGWPRHKILSPAPATWKRALMVPADKHAARRRATTLFGTDKHWKREKDHNRAEAALLALWGALQKG